MEDQSTQQEIARLERRLADVLARHGGENHPLLGDVRVFADAALTALRQQEKLIRISDTVQADLYEKRQALKQLNQEKTLFFSIVAHDLRNPIYAQLNTLELLEDPAVELSQEEQQEVIGAVRESGRRLAALLENLLDWASVNMNTLPFQPAPVPLRETLVAVGKSVAEQAETKGVTLRYPEHAPMAHADLRMLKTILRNLLTNAIKFSHPGGEVALQAWEEGDRVLVSVVDHGVGMSEDVKARVFDKTVKTSSGGTGGERGSGVGLILVGELVARHGGEIAVDSRAGEGSAFTFSLPRAHEAPPVDAPNAPSPGVVS